MSPQPLRSTTAVERGEPSLSTGYLVVPISWAEVLEKKTSTFGVVTAGFSAFKYLQPKPPIIINSPMINTTLTVYAISWIIRHKNDLYEACLRCDCYLPGLSGLALCPKCKGIRMLPYPMSPIPLAPWPPQQNSFSHILSRP